MLQQNNWKCRLTQVVLYNGRKMAAAAAAAAAVVKGKPVI